MAQLLEFLLRADVSAGHPCCWELKAFVVRLCRLVVLGACKF